MRDKYELAKVAGELRRRLGEDDHSRIDVFQLAYTIEPLTLVFYPMGDRISGMCFKGAEDVLIAINSKMTYGRQRFSMAHELYHYYYDDMSTIICAQDISEKSDIERNANTFASFFLAPPVALSAVIKELKTGRKALDVSDIVKLEQFFGISRQAMLVRLIDEGEIKPDDAEKMRTNVISHALSLGYSDTLYCPLPEEKSRMTYGRYIKRAEELLERGLISDGKYEELLLEAFRADLVYGVEEGGELVD